MTTKKRPSKSTPKPAPAPVATAGPATAQVDEQKAIDLVMEMVAVPGKSREEGRIVETIIRKLKKAGVPDSAILIDQTHRKSPGETGSLIVKLPGTKKLPRRLLMAHVDTVPICVGCKPKISGDYIRSADPTTGLGGDDRAGAAVVLNTWLELRRQRLEHPPLTLFFPVQEEIGLYGARYASLTQLGKPTYGFNWDGGDPTTACIGATGDYGIEIEIKGIASHAGAHPEDGVSAIAIASLAIADLARGGWHGLIVKESGRGTANVGVIAGGDATNVVTPSVTLRAEVRSHDPNFRKVILERYRHAFVHAVDAIRAADGRCGNVQFDAELKYEAFRLDPEMPVVKLATAAIARNGLQPQTRISNGGLDANWMTAHGLPTVTLGCGQDDIHTVQERLHLPSYLHACRIGLLLASGELG